MEERVDLFPETEVSKCSYVTTLPAFDILGVISNYVKPYFQCLLMNFLHETIQDLNICVFQSFNPSQ